MRLKVLWSELDEHEKGIVAVGVIFMIAVLGLAVADGVGWL